MARKKAEPKKTAKPNNNAYIEGAGLVADEKITMSLEKNYMPYAMSVLVSRAFPEIDGFKPSHRKLLYTMYKMGLLNGKLTKSANIVGATMRLNPHGDGFRTKNKTQYFPDKEAHYRDKDSALFREAKTG